MDAEQNLPIFISQAFPCGRPMVFYLRTGITFIRLVFKTGNVVCRTPRSVKGGIFTRNTEPLCKLNPEMIVIIFGNKKPRPSRSGFFMTTNCQYYFLGGVVDAACGVIPIFFNTISEISDWSSA